MKIKNLLTVLLFSILTFSGCVEKTETVHMKNIPVPEYSVDQKVLKNRIADVIPAKKINISTSKTETDGKPVLTKIKVEIISPKEYPSNIISFISLAGDVKKAVESGIDNIDDFQKMEIEVRDTTVGENETESHKSYKREFSL